ncbi:MAG: type II toxin-antitoxin system RelE/ParE family toxin [Halapricum sp.]
MATVLLHPDVEAHLQSLPDDIECRVRSKLADAGDDPERHLKPLRGRDDYSLRIGKRRAIIDWRQRAGELRVLDVDTRDTVYD